ncbi:hypothetical protein ACVJDU_008719 [Bradyrhizobium diazoefficiens]
MISNAPAAIAVSPISLTLMIVAKNHVAESRDAGGDHHDAEESADPQRRRAQNPDVRPAVIDCHAILLIRAMIGTLGMVASSPRRRHPTKP